MSHISTGVEYGLHCLLFLAGPPAGVTEATVRDLAEMRGVSVEYLAKLFTKLQRAGLVVATEGARGGFALARSAERISVLDVVSAIDGKKSLFDCRNIRTGCAVFGSKAPDGPRAASARSTPSCSMPSACVTSSPTTRSRILRAGSPTRRPRSSAKTSRVGLKPARRVAVAPAARIHLPAMCKRSLMSHLRVVGTAVLLAFSAQPVQQALAAEQAAVTPLMQKDLPDYPGKEMMAITVTHPPGAVDPIHRHDAHAIIYVLEGSIVMGVKGGKEVTLTPGRTFYEGPNDIHTVGRNASTTKPAKFLVVFSEEEGRRHPDPGSVIGVGEEGAFRWTPRMTWCCRIPIRPRPRSGSTRSVR